MRRIERLCIYSGLAVAIGLGLGLRLPQNTANATAAAQEDRLIAVVDVVQLLEDALQTEEYNAPREQLRTSLISQIETAQQQLVDLQSELQLTPQSDPRFAQMVNDFQSKQGALQQLSQSAAVQFDQLAATQAAEVYQKIHTAAGEIGAAEGYAYVVASRVPSQFTNAQNLANVTQQIIARPIIHGGAGRDLTAKVRAALGVPEAPAADEAVLDMMTSPDQTPEQAPDAGTPTP
jgi:Skp family chaperone for outer membrane proteins